MKALQKYLPEITIICFFAFVYSGIKNFIYCGGDHVFLVTPEFYAPYFESIRKLKILDILQNRRLLIVVYSGVYELFNNNLVYASWFLASFHLLSSLALYKFLKFFCNQWSALIGALFFLTYTGKFQILGEYQGTAYNLVIFLMILQLIVLFKFTQKPLTRFLLISSLFWCSLLIYEVLIVLAPMFVIYQFLELKNKNLSPFKQKTLYLSAIPSIIAMLHVGIIALAANPIWNRIESEETSIFYRLLKIPRVFRWGLEAILGPDFFHSFSYGLLSFFRDTLSNDYTTVSLSISSLVLLILSKKFLNSEKLIFNYSYKKTVILLLAAAAISPHGSGRQ